MEISKIDMSVYEARLENSMNKFLSDNSMYFNDELKENVKALEHTVL